MTNIALPRSCANCGELGCKLNIEKQALSRTWRKTSFVLDEVWPEFASYVSATAGEDDQLIAPGILGKPLVSRYRWQGRVSHKATIQTVKRHLTMRRVAGATGAIRQKAYLENDRLVAEALAHHVDYRSRHLVVAQTWLPWLQAAGVLGGRSYDVAMSRYPMAEIHRRLDAVADHFAESKTVSDFRADERWVAHETAALQQARSIITPHHGIAALFPEQAVLLPWHRPKGVSRRVGKRVAFLGPTIARQRIDIVRDVACRLPEPLIVMGAELEGKDFWADIPVERRQRGENWLDGVGAIIHPAAMTTQPRTLLHAIAAGVLVYADDGCGLASSDYRPLQMLSELTPTVTG